MKIAKYCAYGTAIAGVAFVTGVFGLYDKTSDNHYSNRIKNMEYVKKNSSGKYIETLEIVNKTKSPRIGPEYIDNIWQKTAKELQDSIKISKKEI